MIPFDKHLFFIWMGKKHQLDIDGQTLTSRDFYQTHVFLLFEAYQPGVNTEKWAPDWNDYWDVMLVLSKWIITPV